MTVTDQLHITEQFLDCSELKQEMPASFGEQPPGCIVTAPSEVTKIENDFTGCTDKTKAIFLFCQLYCVTRGSVSIKRLPVA
jgi:hypothetical protein